MTHSHLQRLKATVRITVFDVSRVLHTILLQGRSSEWCVWTGGRHVFLNYLPPRWRAAVCRPPERRVGHRATEDNITFLVHSVHLWLQMQLGVIKTSLSSFMTPLMCGSTVRELLVNSSIWNCIYNLVHSAHTMHVCKHTISSVHMGSRYQCATIKHVYWYLYYALHISYCVFYIILFCCFLFVVSYFIYFYLVRLISRIPIYFLLFLGQMKFEMSFMQNLNKIILIFQIVNAVADFHWMASSQNKVAVRFQIVKSVFQLWPFAFISNGCL